MKKPAAPIPRVQRLHPSDASVASLPVPRGRSAADYEFQVVTLPRGTSLTLARAEVADEVDRGRWDMVRTRMYVGGARKVWMRRRIIRMRSTLGSYPP